MRPLLLKGARLIDPSAGLDEVGDLLIQEGLIEAVGGMIEDAEEAERIEVRGLVVAPGFIDLHVHLREPGGEHKETIESGAQAAVAGGFTTVWAMPNTDPPIDDPAAVGFVSAAGARARGARVEPVGAASIGMKGEKMTEIGELVGAGAVAVTDDGHPVWDPVLMRRLLEYTQTFGIPVLQHSEDRDLAAGGVMNEGVVATELGLRGIPNVAEAAAVARDCYLAELTGGHLHVMHVSARQSVEQIRLAKARGVQVTAEVTPHHLALTEEDVGWYRTDMKMNPPLRSAEDRRALIDALTDGTIDIIATDHAPHHYEEKEREFDDAPFGIVGLETAFAVSNQVLVVDGSMSIVDLVERMASGPARIMRLGRGTLRQGSPADIVVLDPGARWVVDPSRFVSRSRNTPFAGAELTGQVVHTIVGGRVRFSAADRQAVPSTLTGRTEDSRTATTGGTPSGGPRASRSGGNDG